MVISTELEWHVQRGSCSIWQPSARPHQTQPSALSKSIQHPEARIGWLTWRREKCRLNHTSFGGGDHSSIVQHPFIRLPPILWARETVVFHFDSSSIHSSSALLLVFPGWLWIKKEPGTHGLETAAMAQAICGSNSCWFAVSIATSD